MNSVERAVIDAQVAWLDEAIREFDALPRWRRRRRELARDEVETGRRVLAALRLAVSHAEMIRLEEERGREGADGLLLRCLEYFRCFDLERVDGGVSPIIADLEEVLALRGVPIPAFPPPRLLDCPAGCDVRIAADDVGAQVAHLEVHHPQIVVQRLHAASMRQEAEAAAARLGVPLCAVCGLTLTDPDAKHRAPRSGRVPAGEHEFEARA